MSQTERSPLFENKKKTNARLLNWMLILRILPKGVSIYAFYLFCLSLGFTTESIIYPLGILQFITLSTFGTWARKNEISKPKEKIITEDYTVRQKIGYGTTYITSLLSLLGVWLSTILGTAVLAEKIGQLFTLFMSHKKNAKEIENGFHDVGVLIGTVIGLASVYIYWNYKAIIKITNYDDILHGRYDTNTLLKISPFIFLASCTYAIYSFFGAKHGFRKLFELVFSVINYFASQAGKEIKMNDYTRNVRDYGELISAGMAGFAGFADNSLFNGVDQYWVYKILFHEKKIERKQLPKKTSFITTILLPYLFIALYVIASFIQYATAGSSVFLHDVNKKNKVSHLSTASLAPYFMVVALSAFGGMLIILSTLLRIFSNKKTQTPSYESIKLSGKVSFNIKTDIENPNSDEEEDEDEENKSSFFSHLCLRRH